MINFWHLLSILLVTYFCLFFFTVLLLFRALITAALAGTSYNWTMFFISKSLWYKVFHVIYSLFKVHVLVFFYKIQKNRNIKYQQRCLACILAINWFTMSVISWHNKKMFTLKFWSRQKRRHSKPSLLLTHRLTKLREPLIFLSLPQLILLRQKLLITNMKHARDCNVSTVFQGL